MNRSWLIQRLQAPTGHVNPCAFGGGLKDGGLSEEAMKLVSRVWSFDYMGSAEFEFGKVPEVLAKLFPSLTLVAKSFILHYEYEDSWHCRPAQKYEGEKRVYYICEEKDEKEVKKRLAKWAVKEAYGDTKEAIMLNSSMANREKHGRPVEGWLELDNGFMFFTDEKMWRNTCTLFDVMIYQQQNPIKEQ